MPFGYRWVAVTSNPRAGRNAVGACNLSKAVRLCGRQRLKLLYLVVSFRSDRGGRGLSPYLRGAAGRAGVNASPKPAQEVVGKAEAPAADRNAKVGILRCARCGAFHFQTVAPSCCTKSAAFRHCRPLGGRANDRHPVNSLGVRAACCRSFCPRACRWGVAPHDPLILMDRVKTRYPSDLVLARQSEWAAEEFDREPNRSRYPLVIVLRCHGRCFTMRRIWRFPWRTATISRGGVPGR